MSASALSFRTAYARALGHYLRDPTETTLRVAYELGREGVRRQLSVLELAVVHQDALLAALSGAPGRADVQGTARAAGDFFVESLAAFEMVQRGLGEARAAALNERRYTDLSRRLSTFLADVSLALDASESLGEMLQLVAEHARELVGGQCCVATVALEGAPRSAEATVYEEQEARRWRAFVQWLDLPSIYDLLRQSGGSIRVAGEHLPRLAPFQAAARERPLRGWLAASLTTLDGGGLGAVQLFDKHGGPFTSEDQAALVHLAQMASAAVDRALLHRDSRGD